MTFVDVAVGVDIGFFFVLWASGIGILCYGVWRDRQERGS